MNSDPTRNTVVFQLRRGDEDLAFVTEAPTLAEDCIAQAWQIVQLRHQTDPAEVSALETEWEPSERDQQFIRRTFPGLRTVEYHFARPADPRQWEEAFEAARRSIQRSAPASSCWPNASSEATTATLAAAVHPAARPR